MKRIALQVVSEAKTHAYDRRRLLPFTGDLAKENIAFETYTDIKQLNIAAFDYIIISIRSDLPFIHRKIKQEGEKLSRKIIFDYCDFIHVANPVIFFLKSVLAKNRKNFSFLFSRKKFLDLLSGVGTVVVGSQAQKDLIQQYNSDIRVISDILDEIPELSVRSVKQGRIVLWEGFASSNFFIFKKLFKILQGSKSYEQVNVVTDLDYYFLAGKYFRISTDKLLNFLGSLYGGTKVHTAAWNVTNLIESAMASDIALLPIPRDRISRMKPENKIVLMIRLGLCPVMSDIPSYRDFCKKYDLDLCFSTDREAVSILNNIEERIQSLSEKRQTILSDYSRETIGNKWKLVLSLI